MQHGFQLIEVLSILVIVSILSLLSIPIYSQYTERSHRVEAATTLSKLAVELERYHAANETYRGATLQSLHHEEYIAGKRYKVSIESQTNNSFLLKAQPILAANKQDKCGALTLNSWGEKRITGSSPVSECW